MPCFNRRTFAEVTVPVMVDSRISNIPSAIAAISISFLYASKTFSFVRRVQCHPASVADSETLIYTCHLGSVKWITLFGQHGKVQMVCQPKMLHSHSHWTDSGNYFWRVAQWVDIITPTTGVGGRIHALTGIRTGPKSCVKSSMLTILPARRHFCKNCKYEYYIYLSDISL